MEELRELLQQMLNENLVQIVLSNARRPKEALKVKVRPVAIKGELLFQETLYRGSQVFHANYSKEELLPRLLEYIENFFKQAQLLGTKEEAVLLVSKKGKISIKRKILSKPSREAGTEAKAARDLSHNRSKQYILQDGKPVDFLVGLGVQTEDGRVTKAKYDKFRQINRYLEFIQDVLEELPKDRCIRIIDFGCGKSYLTFALYYYLHILQQRDISVTGLDLKEDVIRNCNRLAEELHYTGLHFEQGDISGYQGEDHVDMVVTLHACDTATDYALEKAVKWGADVIMAVPCCQHELNRQIHCEALKPVLKYGVIKERMSALITDALRAELLQQRGYSTQILEFIDLEHTPKNLLIRAVRNKKMQPKTRGKDELARAEEFLNVSPTLEKLLGK